MSNILTAHLDESYIIARTGERVERIREVAFVPKPVGCCRHTHGSICADCAPNWQFDYQFTEPFPFERVRRTTVRDLVDAGTMQPGDRLFLPRTGIPATVTADGGLRLPNGRVYTNRTAAENAARE